MQFLVQKVKEVYGLDLIFKEVVNKGFLSKNFILETESGTKYFLKKYRFKNEDRIKEVHSVKKYFSDGGIPVIMPIFSKDSQSYFEHQGEFYTLFPFVEGRQLDEKTITNKAIVSLAETLAKMHLLGAKAKIPVNDFFKLWNREKRLEVISKILDKISHIDNKTAFDMDAEKNVLLKKSIIEANREVYDSVTFTNDHLTHGDYFIANAFFDSKDEVSHVFDFEKAQYAPRFFELYRSMIYCTFSNSEINEETIARAKLYFDTYRKIYPMSDQELKTGFDAYYLRAAHSVWVEEEHYLNGNTRVDDLLKTDIFRINYLTKNLEKFKQYLLG